MSTERLGATAALSGALQRAAEQPLPPPVADAARGVLLDALGCGFAGAVEPIGCAVREELAGAAGRSEASVAGLARPVDAASAAFANGVAVHALDFEPIGWPSCHAPAAVLPAVLALAERIHASGEDLLRAFALGWEVELRLRSTGSLRPAFHPLGVYGPVAAAAACAVLLGLGASGIEAAIAIGASSAAGLAANGHTPVKVLHAGSAARAGVVAALQAKAGVPGSRGVLEGPSGYGDAFYASVDWSGIEAIDPDGGLGYTLSPETVIHKPYPVQLPMLNVIDAVLDLRAQGVSAPDVESLELVVGRVVASRSNPRPQRGHAGKFSPEYCAAVALVFGEIGLGTFHDATVSDPRVVDVIDRTTIVEREDAGFFDVTARVRFARGGTAEVSRSSPRGSGGNRLTREQRLAKLRGCLAVAGIERIADELVSTVERLESADDVARLGALVRTPMTSSDSEPMPGRV